MREHASDPDITTSTRRCSARFAPSRISMITLRELAAWEDRLGLAVARAHGTAEARDLALAREGIYADYSAVFGSYAALISEEADGMEALKRATFLAWYDVVEPSFLTGIGDLSESTVRAVLEALDARCRSRPTDAELRFMVPWYVSRSEFALLRFPGLDGIAALARRASGDPLARVPRDAAAFEGRGLMGHYWLAAARAT